MAPVEVTAVIGAVTVCIGTVIALVKLRPEKDSLVLTQAQGAATILNDLVNTLRDEITRLREENKRLTELNTQLKEEVRNARGG